MWIDYRYLQQIWVISFKWNSISHASALPHKKVMPSGRHMCIKRKPLAGSFNWAIITMNLNGPIVEFNPCTFQYCWLITLPRKTGMAAVSP